MRLTGRGFTFYEDNDPTKHSWKLKGEYFARKESQEGILKKNHMASKSKSRSVTPLPCHMGTKFQILN
jgi:hypothetical protein